MRCVVSWTGRRRMGLLAPGAIAVAAIHRMERWCRCLPERHSVSISNTPWRGRRWRSDLAGPRTPLESARSRKPGRCSRLAEERLSSGGADGTHVLRPVRLDRLGACTAHGTHVRPTARAGDCANTVRLRHRRVHAKVRRLRNADRPAETTVSARFSCAGVLGPQRPACLAQEVAVNEVLDTSHPAMPSCSTSAAAAAPEAYRAAHLDHGTKSTMFDRVHHPRSGPAQSLHVEQGQSPSLALVRPLSPSWQRGLTTNTCVQLEFPRRPSPPSPSCGVTGSCRPTARHDLPYHVVGSDLAGVVLRTAPGVTAWKPGEEVVAHCLSVELESSDGHNDTMLDPEQRIWGYETNFGGLAELALVKTNQLARSGSCAWPRRRVSASAITSCARST